MNFKPGQKVAIKGPLAMFIGTTATFIRQLTEEENNQLPKPYDNEDGGLGILIKVEDPGQQCKIDLPDVGSGVVVIAPKNLARIN